MINNHVTSLELSKKLKELGVKQESEFYWNKKRKVTRVKHIKKYYCYLSEASTEVEGYDIVGRNVSAFLSSEIGEVFKNVDYSDIWGAYQSCGGNEIGLGQIVMQSIDINFLARMLIYLIENSIIDVKSL